MINILGIKSISLKELNHITWVSITEDPNDPHNALMILYTSPNTEEGSYGPIIRFKLEKAVYYKDLWFLYADLTEATGTLIKINEIKSELKSIPTIEELNDAINKNL